MDKSYTIFEVLSNGFSNSLSIVPILRELWEELEKIDDDKFEEMGEKYPKIKELLLQLKVLIKP